MKVTQEISDYDIQMVRDIETFFQSPAGKYFINQMRIEREAIIHRGKKNRENEDRAYYWAELDGYDLAVTKHDRMKSDMEKKIAAKKIVKTVPYGLGGEREYHRI